MSGGPRRVDDARYVPRHAVLPRLHAAVLLAACLLLATATAASASRSASHRKHHHARPRHARRHNSFRSVKVKRPPVTSPSSPTAPLVFGIYPGGAAGTVGPSGPLAPENTTLRLAALEQLRAPGKPFALHLYAQYSGPTGGWSAKDQVAGDIASYTSAGFQVELVLTYRPADRTAATDVPGYVAWVKQAVHDLDVYPGMVSFQVTNEANIAGSPNTSDGDYPGVKDALIQGVIGAKAQAKADGAAQVKVGFNWAYDTQSSESAFWSYLGTHGGSSFLSALDWVGLDAYPGTWGPALPANLGFGSAVGQGMTTALQTIRQYMVAGRIPATVPLHIAESGYPTGPGRTYAMQATALQSIVAAVKAARGAENIAQLCWFDLRDADSSSTSFESQYGVMSDSYAPKPAFAAYQALVAAG
jgi:hypothetical protein